MKKLHHHVNPINKQNANIIDGKIYEIVMKVMVKKVNSKCKCFSMPKSWIVQLCMTETLIMTTLDSKSKIIINLFLIIITDIGEILFVKD